MRNQNRIPHAILENMKITPEIICDILRYLLNFALGFYIGRNAGKTMRKLLLLLITTTALSAETIQMSPLIDECDKFLVYRQMFMEDDIGQIKEIVLSLEGEIKESTSNLLKFFITRMEYHIGLPVEMEDMEFPRG